MPKSPRSSGHKYFWLLAVLLVGLCVACYFALAYSFGSLPVYSVPASAVLSATSSASVPTIYVPTHMATPKPVKAIYMTSYVAGVKTWRDKMARLVDDTELNSIVIDVKDYTGEMVVSRAPDIIDYIHKLHDKNIYVIGRVSVFQDQLYVKGHPELAVRRKDNGGVWRDRKGIAWLDPGSKEAWDYIVKVSEGAYAQGFDEINLDYIRFPSDGDMANVAYTFNSTTSPLAKTRVMENFYKYISDRLHARGIPVSVDLFGMVTTNKDDLGIGQSLESALTYFDYVAPMIYPSHFPPTFNGWPDPNKVPGQLITFVMNKAVARADILDGISSTSPASTTPISRFKLRPWLQDFDYGGNYGEAEVRAQIKGVYANGLTSWMLWDPGVKYTTSALDKIATSS